MYNFILFILLSLFCSSCTNDIPAPIEYNYNKPAGKQNKFYSEKTTNKLAEDEIIETSINVENYEETTGSLNNFTEFTQEAKEANQDLGSAKIIYHEVAEDEDLEDIAKKYNQSVEEIAQLNNLDPDEAVEELQIIKIKVPINVLNDKNKELANKNKAILPISQVKYIKPVEGIITSRFGDIENSQKSTGIVINSNPGTPVKSIAAGEVIYISGNTKFGNLVIVKLYNTDLYVAYAYMHDLIPKVGDKVTQGKIIGHVGTSGNAVKPSLYLAVRKGKVAVDPENYINYSN